MLNRWNQQWEDIEIDIDVRTSWLRPLGSWVLDSGNVVAIALAVSQETSVNRFDCLKIRWSCHTYSQVQYQATNYHRLISFYGRVSFRASSALFRPCFMPITSRSIRIINKTPNPQIPQSLL